MFSAKWKASGHPILGACGISTTQTIEQFERVTGLKWSNELASAVLIEPIQSDPCYICGKPSIQYVNIMAGAACTVPSVMKAVCEEHSRGRFYG